ncbi:hypothetical protein DFH09DRAFT_1076425 [Mycena vulgaris]|nr:hypothetical protein DFH09DRAFT_1076425 [Mycena vulgaris]
MSGDGAEQEGDDADLEGAARAADWRALHGEGASESDVGDGGENTPSNLAERDADEWSAGPRRTGLTKGEVGAAARAHAREDIEEKCGISKGRRGNEGGQARWSRGGRRRVLDATAAGRRRVWVHRHSELGSMPAHRVHRVELGGVGAGVRACGSAARPWGAIDGDSGGKVVGAIDMCARARRRRMQRGLAGEAATAMADGVRWHVKARVWCTRRLDVGVHEGQDGERFAVLVSSSAAVLPRARSSQDLFPDESTA